MFACSRQPRGVSNIMAIDESNEAYIHVVRVLLEAAVDSPTDLLLRADNCTSIARLRQLIKIPGLHERAVRHGLNEDQYDDLQAIEPYINWVHNEDHSDVTTQTRGSFDHFFDHVYDVNNPTLENKEAEDNTNDTRTVSALVLDLTVSLIQALRSPKITTEMASRLERTDIRRILSERDIPPTREDTDTAVFARQHTSC